MNKQESKYFNTALLMNEALLLLLEKKDYEYITIKEICEKAGVNRSTFYLHYETIDDLLEEMVDNLNKKFIESFSKDLTIDKAVNEDLILTTSKYLTPYLNFIKENKTVFRLAIKKPYIMKSNKSFSRLEKYVFEPILNKYKVKAEEKKYILEFYTKGVLAIVYKWLNEDCKDEISLIIDLIERLTFANVKD
ncbi:MAG: TetR/AcrR family transcriptional regulator [Bacilli bacterium]|nr:TetR/AcrR family transcriptional regulator [Bacilli bacterium]